MTQLDQLYICLLDRGLMVLRHAVLSKDQEWAEAEIEVLHNVPSLIGEENVARHRYYWFKERQSYIDWVSAPGREEAKSRMLTYYEPLWREMEPLVAEMVAMHESSA